MPEVDDFNNDLVLSVACPYDLDLLVREVNLGLAGFNGGVDGGLVSPAVSDLGCYEVQ